MPVVRVELQARLRAGGAGVDDPDVVDRAAGVAAPPAMPPPAPGGSIARPRTVLPSASLTTSVAACRRWSGTGPAEPDAQRGPRRPDEVGGLAEQALAGLQVMPAS